MSVSTSLLGSGGVRAWRQIGWSIVDNFFDVFMVGSMDSGHCIDKFSKLLVYVEATLTVTLRFGLQSRNTKKRNHENVKSSKEI